MSNNIPLKRIKFAHFYVNDANGNGTKAAVLAGFSEKSASSIAKKLLDDPEVQKLIEQKLKEQFEEYRHLFLVHARDAIIALVEVMHDGKGLAKVAAANSILDRAGFKPVEHIKAQLDDKRVIKEIPIDQQRQAILDAAEAIQGEYISE